MSYLTKSEYLAQRAQWKQEYAALSIYLAGGLQQPGFVFNTDKTYLGK